MRDLKGVGTYDPALDLGVAAASVTVVDAAGTTAAGKTGPDGTITADLSKLAGGKYRVQVDPPAGSVLQPAPAGSSLSSTTSFVDVSDHKNVSLVVGLWNPADYCQENPTLVTGCQRNGIAPGIDPAARSLVTLPFTARGTGPSPTQLASQGQTGTVYGIAYRSADKRVFSGAFAKRAAAYGPGGPGAIYVTDTVAKTTKLFATVPNAGASTHNMQAGADSAFANVAGKESLGDVDISEDGATLYVVNLANRRLYLYDATLATAAAPKASYAIPNPDCPAAGDWRPGALGVRDGVVYVGGVCSGESTQKLADMRVVVRTFDPAAGTFGAPVVNQALSFERGTALWQGSATNHWNPWQTTFKEPTPYINQLVTYAEPLLTDIGVEARGDLVLAFRDRFGDQGGKAMPPADGSPGVFDTVSGGDLNRVCRLANGSYAWEGTSGCPNNNTAANNGGGESTTVVEYYPGEYYSDSTHGKPHNETAQGAIAMVYGAGRMPATVMDPTDINTGGIGWFDRTDGTMANANHSNAYLISDSATEGWGKANGLADIEALCDQAPVQIGDRVWFDSNANGIQDPGEPAVAGVSVQLSPCAGGAPLATKATDAQGLYHFGAADGLKPNTCYALQFDYSKVDPATLPGSPPISAVKWTISTAGADRLIDSNVDNAGKATVTTGKPGAVDHGIDAGLVAALNKVGDYVWIDQKRTGLQDAGDPGVGTVPVTLQDGSGKVVATTTTDANGKYLFDNLPDGTYKVCFDTSKLPAPYAGYLLTKQNAAGHNGKDSAADPGTGCTMTTTLGPDRREDMTLDAGLVAPANRVGDYVWIDQKHTGLQDAGDPGVGNVPVTLQDSSGKVVATTTTDANGKYLFDNLPDGTYKVCIDTSKLPAPYSDYMLTKQNAASHNGKDSAADPATGCTMTTTLGADHREDLTLDAGLVAPANRLGDYVWVDQKRTGLQDTGDPAVGNVPVTLQDSSGKVIATTTTDANGKYLFDNLPDGTYKVCIDTSKLPAPYSDYMLTKQNVASHNGKDSAADPGTGCTMSTTLGVGHREDLTLDVGLVSPANRVGDYVWVDQKRTGLQDTGDPGAANVPVTLQDGSGKVVATTTTDANGKYLFDNLPDGAYKVCVSLAKLPKNLLGYTFTKAGAAGHNGSDSAADPTTGCTPVVTLNPSHRQDLTLDVGLLANANPSGPSTPTTGLAFTGADVIWAAAAGLLLLVGGAVLAIVGRRRRRNG